VVLDNGQGTTTAEYNGDGSVSSIEQRPSAIDEAYAPATSGAAKPTAEHEIAHVLRFVVDCCDQVAGTNVGCEELFAAYESWCGGQTGHGQEPRSVASADAMCLTLSQNLADVTRSRPRRGKQAMIGLRLKPVLDRHAPTAMDSASPPPAEPERVRVSGAVDVMLEDIIEEVGNHRVAAPDDEAKIQAIAESMRQVGQLQPIRLMRVAGQNEGSGGPFTLVFGSRRLRARRLIAAPSIRAEICDWMTDEQVAAARAIENLQREDLSPIEECTAVGHLVAALKDQAGSRGLTDQEAYDAAAARLGKSATWVRDRAYLERLSALGREVVAQRVLPLGHARSIARLADHEVQNGLIAWATGADDEWKPGQPLFNDDGPMRREVLPSLSEVDGMVGPHLRSLKLVQWRLDKPFAGAPACELCPNNSRNDRMLFEHQDAQERADLAAEAAELTDEQRREMEQLGPADERPATCLNEGCFERKQRATEAALAKGLKDVREAIKEAKREKTELPLTEKGLAAVMPDVVRPGTFARKAKQEFGPEHDRRTAVGDGVAAPGRKDSKPAPAAPVDPKQRAKDELERAEREWGNGARDLIHAASRKDPALALCLVAFDFLEPVNTIGQGWSSEESVRKALVSPTLAKALVLLKKRSGEAAAELWALSQMDIEDVTESVFNGTAELLERVATACGLKTPPRPVLADFVSEAGASKKPAAKGAAGKAKKKPKAKALKGGKKKAGKRKGAVKR
jgi:ParB/RepB/Spo0J family partition protein